MNMPIDEPCDVTRNLFCKGFQRHTGLAGVCTSRCRIGDTPCDTIIAGTECRWPNQGLGHCAYPSPAYTDLGKPCNDGTECMSGICGSHWYGDRCTASCSRISDCGLVGRCVIFTGEDAYCLRLCSSDGECDAVAAGEVCDNDRGYTACYPRCETRGSCPMLQSCQTDGHCR